MNSHQKGRTMIEAILVLALVAVVISGFIKVVGSAFSKYKISRVVQQLYELQKGINERFAIVGNYDLLDTTVHSEETIAKFLEGTTVAGQINNRIAPTDMSVSGGFLRHKYGGIVKVKAVTLEDLRQGATGTGVEGKNQAYEITFEDVPGYVCHSLALMNWVVNDATDLIGIRFNKTAAGESFRWPKVGESRTTSGANLLPVTLTDSMDTNNCPDRWVSTISWTFQ